MTSKERAASSLYVNFSVL